MSDNNIEWATLAAVTSHLDAEDDPALWSAVATVVFADARALCRAAPAGTRVVAQFGRCSHWLRPHQTRWTADGGFAWPTGYGGRRHSRTGLPEFDWFVGGVPGPRDLLFRVAVPARSARHDQAAVHTVWRPRPPVGLRGEWAQFYGFRRRTGAWACTAYRGVGEGVYELAAAAGGA